MGHDVASRRGAAQTFRRQTLRLIVHTSIGGERMRIRLSNLHGDRSLVIRAARAARRVSGARIDGATEQVLTFGGTPSVTIAPHAEAVSDGARLAVPAFGDLAIDLDLPGETAARHLCRPDATEASPFTDAALTRSERSLPPSIAATPDDRLLTIADVCTLLQIRKAVIGKQRPKFH